MRGPGLVAASGSHEGSNPPRAIEQLAADSCRRPFPFRSLFGIVRIVEEHGQLYASMPELGKPERVTVARIERGGSVVRGKDNERVKQREDAPLLFRRECCKSVARRLRFATMAQDDLRQIDTAPIMSVRRRGPHAPERSSQELRPHRSIEVPLVKIWPNIVAFKIGKDIFDEEGL